MYESINSSLCKTLCFVVISLTVEKQPALIHHIMHKVDLLRTKFSSYFIRKILCSKAPPLIHWSLLLLVSIYLFFQFVFFILCVKSQYGLQKGSTLWWHHVHTCVLIITCENNQNSTICGVLLSPFSKRSIYYITKP